ncbi:MAG: hypothetical protein V2B20_22175 [Pseudomonadota bacterium]
MQFDVISKIPVQEVFMKSIKRILFCSSLLLLSSLLTACLTDTQTKEENSPTTQETLKPQDETNASSAAVGLPVKYQTPMYLVDKKTDNDNTLAEEAKLKVGARISSTRGPQPLWDILKRLAGLKGMNISWSSDVDQNVLVDVNISADDDFFAAIDNLLRQVDYYHEVKGNTIIVKYKETRQFHIAMPFIKQTYKTKTGGDVLGGETKSGASVAGEISLASEGVAITQQQDGKPGGIEFNIWNSIENNLNATLSIWSTDDTAPAKPDTSSSNKPTVIIQQTAKKTESIETAKEEPPVSATFKRSKSGNSYFIDKPVGLITVTASRPIQEKLELYFKALKKELYKQVSIEAKIIEVQLTDSSSIGLNWNTILSNLSVTGGTLSGAKTYSNTKTDTSDLTNSLNNTNTTTNTTTNTVGNANSRDTQYNYMNSNSPTVDTGTNAYGDTSITTGSSNVAENIVSDVTTGVASSGVTAATVITQGVTGVLGGGISLAAFSFDSFLHAVSKQGQATILSNPKISVMNGQASLITVGRNVTYISKITATVTDNAISYSADTARALSGVGLALTANILDDKQIILNLVPVTSELATEDIAYRTIGLGSVGLPIINVREMSTTVRVKDGEMLVIGGLISGNDSNTGTFLPGTSNLGFFKYLFGAEVKAATKRELIILLKARII